MCLGAILWSGIGTVVFGSSIRFLQKQGWRQIDILAEEVGAPEPGVGLYGDRRRPRTGMQCLVRAPGRLTGSRRWPPMRAA